MIGTTTAAVLFCIITTFVIAFQIALALGAPWGEMAMGGKFPGQFPPRMRVVALIQSVVLFLLAAIVLTRAGIILEHMLEYSIIAIWVVVVLCAVSAIMNAITPSKRERIVWAPVALVWFACAFIVASR